MIRVDVVHRDLFTGRDVAQGEEEDVPVDNLDEAIGAARMVDELRAVAAATAVDAPVRIYRADVQPLLPAHAPRRLDARDALTHQFRDLLPFAKRRGRKTT